MSAWGTQAMLAFNIHGSKLPVDVQKNMKRWIRRDRSGGKILPEPELCRRFQESFSDSNKWVIANYLANAPDALDPDWKRFDDRSQPTKIDFDELRMMFESASAVGDTTQRIGANP
jgi:hypothetical protein